MKGQESETLDRAVAVSEPMPLFSDAEMVDFRSQWSTLQTGFVGEPCQTVENDLHGVLGGALAIGVLDAQEEGPAAMARIKPVEQRGPCGAYVHQAGRRGGDAGDDRSFGGWFDSGHRGSG